MRICSSHSHLILPKAVESLLGVPKTWAPRSERHPQATDVSLRCITTVHSALSVCCSAKEKQLGPIPLYHSQLGLLIQSQSAVYAKSVLKNHLLDFYVIRAIERLEVGELVRNEESQEDCHDCKPGCYSTWVVIHADMERAVSSGAFANPVLPSLAAAGRVSN